MKFLIIKTSSLGDIIHAFPSLHFLRDRFPHATIDWVVEAPLAELVTKHPEIDSVFTVETKKWRRGAHLKSFFHYCKRVRKKKYDFAFDLQGNIKSSLLLSVVRAKQKVGFGLKSVPEWPNIFFTDVTINPLRGQNIRQDYLEVVQGGLGDHSQVRVRDVKLLITQEEKSTLTTLLASLPDRRKVLVAPGSAWENKQLSLQQLVAFLKRDKDAFFLFSWGNEREKNICRDLISHFPENGLILERMPLALLQNLMSQVNLVIAMDSLPLHLAGTTKTPTYSFFGPTLAEKYQPPGLHHQFAQGSCPYNIIFNKRCPKLRTCKSGACIKDIKL